MWNFVCTWDTECIKLHSKSYYELLKSELERIKLRVMSNKKINFFETCTMNGFSVVSNVMGVL